MDFTSENIPEMDWRGRGFPVAADAHPLRRQPGTMSASIDRRPPTECSVAPLSWKAKPAARDANPALWGLLRPRRGSRTALSATTGRWASFICSLLYFAFLNAKLSLRLQSSPVLLLVPVDTFSTHFNVSPSFYWVEITILAWFVHDSSISTLMLLLISSETTCNLIQFTE